MNIINEQSINLPDVVEALKEGKTIVYPTETCYGLGCDATSEKAVEKVFAIKQRQREKSVLVVVPDMDMAMEYVDWTPTIDRLAEKYWPGPLTIVAPLKNGITLPKGVVAPDNTIAFRVSSHPFVTALSEALGVPLVSTSANIASEDSPYDIGRIKDMFGENAAQPDILIDAGTLPHQSPSTIVRVVGDKVEVLRQGEIVIDF